METVVTVLVLLFVVFVALGVFAAVKVVGAAKRSVDRTITQARRTVEDHTLRAKSFAQPGPAGELAQLRLTLRTSMRATQDALYAGVREDESLKESIALFERLSAHGRELDTDLKRLEADPDRATLSERLPVLRERTRRITESAESLRWAARDRARRFADDDLDTLSAQIDMEAGALRHWTTAEPTTEHTTGAAGPAAGRTAESPAPGADSPTWSGAPRQASAEEPARPAITPSGRRPAYPWQKKPRPESTT
ncbi:hypothetical protein ACIOC2_00640 [Streptomyces sp. NPDC088337]|uniref:hypothetical protein n=1 Tax=unclassified Streptomyces TaxID=2593676 RepID=UPI002DD9535D|nr:hypothetical protein [Streptomyces sp. NBC_01788]WSB26700.1 hypothetical protein OIE49_12765 [Streptomyces sp. NBC_01788]